MLSNMPNRTAGKERMHVASKSPERAHTVWEAETSLILNVDFEGRWDRPASTLEYEIWWAAL